MMSPSYNDVSSDSVLPLRTTAMPSGALRAARVEPSITSSTVESSSTDLVMLLLRPYLMVMFMVFPWVTLLLFGLRLRVRDDPDHINRGRPVCGHSYQAASVYVAHDTCGRGVPVSRLR